MIHESAAQVERDASRWLLRIDREGRTPELIAELDCWLAADRRHQGAWLQAEAAWAMLDRLDGRHADDEGGIRSLEPKPSAGSVLLSRRRLMLCGASALAASFAGGLLLLDGPEHYSTAVGEIRRVPLVDGSTAAINTQSRIAVAMGPEHRTVRIDVGEAYFQVERDPARPFLVEAGRIRVMAVGTAFSVRRRDGGADVLVTEGIVEGWADTAEGNRVRLGAGQRAFIADNAAIRRLPAAPSEIERALAWRAGRIDLAGETLGHAVNEFNRYNRRPIVLADDGLAAERFHGVFRTDDPEGFALAVRSSLRVPVQVSGTEIRIGRPES